MNDEKLGIKMLIVFLIFTSPYWIMLGCSGYMLITDADSTLNDQAIGRWVSLDFDGENASYIFEFEQGGRGVCYQKGLKFNFDWIRPSDTIIITKYLSYDSSIEMKLHAFYSSDRLYYNDIELYKVTEHPVVVNSIDKNIVDTDARIYNYDNTYDVTYCITGIVGFAILICGLVLFFQGD